MLDSLVPRPLVGAKNLMPQEPVVTVLMSVFNDSEFLGEAIRSILEQSYDDFEFLIIDDGSTDDSTAVLKGLRDPRVRVVRNPVNLGLTRSLKKGVALARGDFIARMDADDVAFPDRLLWQLRFLDRHRDIALLGSATLQTDERG